MVQYSGSIKTQQIYMCTKNVLIRKVTIFLAHKVSTLSV